MSDDHLVHSGHNGNDDLKPSRCLAVTASWILDNRPLRSSVHACVRASNLATEFGVIDVIARRASYCPSPENGEAR